MTAVRAPDLVPVRHNWLVRKYADRLRTYPRGLDPAIIADDLGLQPRTVMMMQLKLGLRRAANHQRGLTGGETQTKGD